MTTAKARRNQRKRDVVTRLSAATASLTGPAALLRRIESFAVSKVVITQHQYAIRQMVCRPSRSAITFFKNETAHADLESLGWKLQTLRWDASKKDG